MNDHYKNDSQFEAQVWLWRHKVLFFTLGALLFIGLLASGNGF
jgi:hypothetical protein